MAQKQIISDQDVFDQTIGLLQEILERDEKRYLPDRHISLEEHDETWEFIAKIEAIQNYDPTPINGWGEPPITAAERHAAAFEEKQIAKGRVNHLSLVK